MPATGPLVAATILTPNLADSIVFYRDLLGLAVIDRDRVPATRLHDSLGTTGARRVTLALADHGQVILIDISTSRPPRPIHLGEPFLAFNTPVFDALVDRLHAANVPFVNEPVTIPLANGVARECAVRDPSGLLINIVAG